MTTRKEQMREAAENHPRMRDISGFDDRGLYHCAFKDGAEWADANPVLKNLTEANIELGNKLAIAVEALKHYSKSDPGNTKRFIGGANVSVSPVASNLEAKLALAKIKDMK